MKIYHNTRDAQYRHPFGAIHTNDTVTLTLDVWDEPDASAVVRTWVDGIGEQLIEMQKNLLEDRCRFTAAITPVQAELLWYSFRVTRADGYIVGYGAKDGNTGGEGVDYYDREPPSFQITVSERRDVPKWYREGIVYQIFPDRFCRGENWEKRVQSLPDHHKKGPKRRLCEDWGKPPIYEKDEKGRVTCWDFYGGTLAGIEEKLGYLKELGISVLYLNPIFEAASNHRYDTGDYTKIDPMLGDNEAFEHLCKKAEEYGISIILDGVFNHTGCDSTYFNKYGNYDNVGAWQSEDSPYRDWYRFDNSPAGYECWWGVDDLPNLEETNESYQKFIYGDKDSIVRRWLRAGAKGWRLDVADELPDFFIEGIKKAVVDELGDEGLLIGEVWEDASNKISYGELRRYLLGTELDAVMNYPLRDGLERFVLGQMSAPELTGTLMSLYENYPKESFYASLNLIGSHDRLRVLTRLGDAPAEETLSESQRAEYRLENWQKDLAKGRLWMVLVMQMLMPGVPCIYYGDEVGMEGYSDPYNRGTYPWGEEDEGIRSMHQNLISLRKLSPLFVDGSFEPFAENEDVFGFIRKLGDERAYVLVNRSRSQTYEVLLPEEAEATELISGRVLHHKDGKLGIDMYPFGTAVIYIREGKQLAEPMEPGCGVLCHVTSIPKSKGKSCFGENAKQFIDFLAQNGQKYWQILPLNPTDFYGSPYVGTSAFAGNPALLGLTDAQWEKQFEQFNPDKDYAAFCEAQKDWLEPYACYCALKEEEGGKPFSQWKKEYRKCSPQVLEKIGSSRRAAFYRYEQYLFEKEWQQVHTYAAEHGIQIIGDMPMYVSEDSADAWAYPENFAVDTDGHPSRRAGVPPDYFSEDGQLWGNPLYRWEAMEKDGYHWWMDRLERGFDLYDKIRLDHFRGFEAYWSVPDGKKAKEGSWIIGPGRKLFEAAYQKFGPLHLIAEDLGIITPGVRGLIAGCGLCGMDVMQFSDTDPMERYEPPKGKLVYSGTHDNATLVGWCKERYPEEDAKKCADKLMHRLYGCEADVVIVPLQDLMKLDDKARMNTPGTTEGNWKWQANEKKMAAAGKYLEELMDFRLHPPVEEEEPEEETETVEE
jgi:4-alpha-glucanotransferase